MIKQNDEKKKEFERSIHPGDRFDSSNRSLNRTNEETLSAIKEGRRIAADEDVPAYRTVDELKADLEK
ncbi:hypothetical protein [Aedoeadaptatus coli]|uniref:hypothetical protein n=1 Tax=Aedoeadaptatus coli TaxID=2058292 RepID=UPI000D54DF26|nr:hypothetical protein [Peptoniphilus coli]